MKSKAPLVYLLLAGVAIAWWWKTGLVSPSPGASGAIKNGAVKSNLTAGSGYNFQVGDQLVYKFSSDGVLRLGSANQANTATDLKLSATGQLRLTVYSATVTGWIVGFVWDQVHLTSDNGQTVTDTTPPDLKGTEVLVFLEKYGRISQLKIPSSLSVDARNNWRDVLARWQVVLPETAQTNRWTRVEEDATGEYVTQYTMSSGAVLPTDIVKKKMRYLRLSSGSPTLAAAYKINSSVQIHFDAYPRIIAGVEKVSLTGVQALGNTESTGDFTFTLGDSPTTAPRTLAQLDLDKYETTKWAGEYTADENPASAESFGDIISNLADFRAVVKSDGITSPDEIRAAEKIIQQLQAAPGLADKVLDELRNTAEGDPLVQALLGILGSAGTPAAQTDLFAIATSDDWPQSLREMALFSFVQTTAPIPAADAWLEGLYSQGGDLANTALLELAAIGAKVNTTDPARFSQINDYVLGILSTPNLSLNDYIAALDAVSNLGPAEVPAAVATAAQNDNPLVRMKAIGSLVRIPTDAALALINNAIANDPSPDVQTAAIKTLAAQQQSAALSQLSTLTTTGNSPQARKEALTQLLPYIATNPILVNVVNTAAQKDSSSEVRDYANQLLGTLNSATHP
jgi:hypothetical protein